MALAELINLSPDIKKVGLSEERVRACLPEIRKFVSFWRAYPDLFIDFLQTGGDESKPKKLKFYHYQRVFLRITARYKYVYATFPRAYSKSFLSVLTLMIKAILYPGAKLFVTAGGKEQGSGILKEKINELCDLVPALRREIDWSRGATKEGKDYCEYHFKNGSIIDNLAAKESSRGKRRHAGLLEECVGIDGDMLNSVVLPIMQIDRRTACGLPDPDEPLNKSQIYVTTAGWKNSFPYQKLIALLVRMVIEPEKAFIMGGTWRVPVAVGLQSRSFINDLRRDATMNDVSFSREFESAWAGTGQDAFFDGDAFDRCRKLQLPEYESSGRSSARAYYVIGFDVGRKGCASIATVFKVTPQSQGPAVKSLVCIYELMDAHFEDQAIWLKKMYYKYKARRLVIDGNGLGIGLIDYMVKSQTDQNDDYYPPFGVYNDVDNEYKKYKTDDTELDAMYIIKANAPINTTAHANFQSQINTGKVRFLIDANTAKAKLMGTVKGSKMTPEERQAYLRPYDLTSVLRSEMLNLREENTGTNIILKQVNRGIPKDTFSSAEYALYYIRVEEEDKKRKKKFNIADAMFMT